jgi:hypothetical protein
MPSPIKKNMLPRKLSGDDQKPEEQHRMSTDEYATAESSQLKEIRIVMGIKDQYVVKWP